MLTDGVYIYFWTFRVFLNCVDRLTLTHDVIHFSVLHLRKTNGISITNVIATKQQVSP